MAIVSDTDVSFGRTDVDLSAGITRDNFVCIYHEGILQYHAVDPLEAVV